MIEVFTWYKDYNKGDTFLESVARIRLEIMGSCLRNLSLGKKMRKNWFSNRVVDEWSG